MELALNAEIIVLRHYSTKLYSKIVVNELRNQQIVDDIVQNFESGRNCLVLILSYTIF